jgi:hypothetical protein
VFLFSEKEWGTAETGCWRHMAVTPPASYGCRAAGVTPGQAMAEVRENFANVVRALDEFPLKVLDRAAEFIETSDLYRGEKVLGQARWLADLQRARQRTRFSHLRDNVTWLAVATAPNGFCHPRSSMIGTLLEDLAGGMEISRVKQRFAEKMNPGKYQRPHAPPSAGNIARAEKLVAELGIEPSLKRRFARLDEVQALWRPLRSNGNGNAGGGIFSHLRDLRASEGIAVERITWAKFRRDVLTHVTALEVLVPQHGNFCALVTAVHADAPPILQWDRKERRNPVSWYVYHGGSPAHQWRLTGGAWARVNAVCLQPSQWFDSELPHLGESAIFILEGAQDTRWAPLGLFPEILKGELREVRATIEDHSRVTRLEGQDHASACGLRTVSGLEGAVRVRLASGARAAYHIDRWE